MLLYIPWFRAQPIELPTPFGTVPVHPFGILVALGVLVGAAVARWKAKRDGLHPEVVMNLGGWVLIPGFVGAHVFDDLAYRPELVLEQPWHLFFLWDGISSFGGFFGAALGAYAWTRRRGVPGIALADPIAFAFPFGWLFGRSGCFWVHDHPGRITDFFLGVADYQVGLPPWRVRHDLGLYEVFWSVAVSVLFLALARRSRARGLYLVSLPFLYAPVRFGLDFLRATDVAHADPRYFGLTPGHYGAIVLFALGVVVARRLARSPWPEIPRWARWPEAGPEVVEAVTASERGSDRCSEVERCTAEERTIDKNGAIAVADVDAESGFRFRS